MRTAPKEFRTIENFARTEDLSFEVAQIQLCSLWTAYCLHWNLECDTATYDTQMLFLWETVRHTPSNPWLDDPGEGVLGFELFEEFMCQFLC